MEDEEEIIVEQSSSLPSNADPSKYLKTAKNTNDGYTIVLTKSLKKNLKKKANQVIAAKHNTRRGGPNNIA